MEITELYEAAKKRHRNKNGEITDAQCVIEQEKEIRYYREKIKLLQEKRNVAETQFSRTSEVLYNAEKAAEILQSFNNTISGLYSISNEEAYIINTLNLPTYVEEEYKKLLSDIGTDLLDVAYKIEMIRSLIFGDCINWDVIYQEIENYMEFNSMIKT